MTGRSPLTDGLLGTLATWAPAERTKRWLSLDRWSSDKRSTDIYIYIYILHGESIDTCPWSRVEVLKIRLLAVINLATKMWPRPFGHEQLGNCLFHLRNYLTIVRLTCATQHAPSNITKATISVICRLASARQAQRYMRGSHTITGEYDHHLTNSFSITSSIQIHTDSTNFWPYF